MQITSFLVLALSALSFAAPVCEVPSGFQINGFTTFAPAEGNPNPSKVFFTLVDSVTGASTFCSHSGTFASGPATCDNGSSQFSWDGTKLTVNEIYTPCFSPSDEALAYGSVNVSVYCYPSEPPMPNGYGTQCQTPTGQISGTFSSDPLLD
ncbi:hypothetical protein B0J14DRAFT_595564 [Halenospora varia]|nr:hypothetical protein B0J14DRAFT_595564 [Halenospora varia]